MKQIIAYLLTSFLTLSCFATSQAINLYNKPDIDSSVVARTTANDKQWLGYYRQGKWLKLGDQKTGRTAWMLLPKTTSIKPEVECTYIQIQQQKNAKPQVIIYKNGKKLDNKQAKKVYEHWRLKQKMMQKQFWQEQEQMTEMFNRQNKMMQRMMLNMMPVPSDFSIKQSNQDQEKEEKLASKKQAQQKIHYRFNRTSSSILSARKAINNLQN